MSVDWPFLYLKSAPRGLVLYNKPNWNSCVLWPFTILFIVDKKIVQEELEKQKAAQRQEEWEAEDLKKRNAALERIEKFKASRENEQSSTDWCTKSATDSRSSAVRSSSAALSASKARSELPSRSVRKYTRGNRQGIVNLIRVTKLVPNDLATQ